MSNKTRILAAVRARPGIGVAELADTLGMFKPNARRDALQLRDKGLVTAKEGETGYIFFPAGGTPPDQENALDHHRLQRWRHEPQVIDVDDFREIPAPSSDSRALVPVSQPYDSRTADALKQIAAAKARAARTPQSYRIAGQAVTSLDQLFVADPTVIKL